MLPVLYPANRRTNSHVSLGDLRDGIGMADEMGLGLLIRVRLRSQFDVTAAAPSLKNSSDPFFRSSPG